MSRSVERRLELAVHPGGPQAAVASPLLREIRGHAPPSNGTPEPGDDRLPRHEGHARPPGRDLVIVWKTTH